MTTIGQHEMGRLRIANGTESLWCRNCSHYFFHSGVDRVAGWVVAALYGLHPTFPKRIFNVDADKIEDA